jgi:hypothetical protein
MPVNNNRRAVVFTLKNIDGKGHFFKKIDTIKNTESVTIERNTTMKIPREFS